MSITGNQTISDPVGRLVRFRMGTRELVGTIAGDRGSLGHGRSRILTVHVPDDPYEPVVFEMPENELTFLGERVPTSPSKAQIIDFLKEGGLASILQSNLGGPRQPQVWLCFDGHQNVTYSFTPTSGGVGGKVVPFWALHEESIFSPKREDVISYIQSFGLSKSEAEDVVQSVGTAP